MKPLVVIGAGLSGLSCALHASKKGLPVLLLEEKAAVGGRVASRRLPNGFLVDEGFQVLLDSYPELDSVVDRAQLHLQCFHSGALIYSGDSLQVLANPFRHPGEILKTLGCSAANLKDKALVVGLMLQSQLQTSDTPLGKPKTLQALKDFGFSNHFIEFFWRPFLAGVYLDNELSLGADFFKFLVRCFGWGKVCLPEQGMAALPQLIAEQLPAGTVRLNTSVAKWTADKVWLQSGELVEASQVICAGPRQSQSPPSNSMFRSVTTYYFTSPELQELSWDRWLILIPQTLGFTISHMALISSVAPSYSASGKPLLSVSVVGKKQASVEAVVTDVQKVAGRALNLELVTVTEVAQALPIVSDSTPGGFVKEEGVIYCGDRYTSPSIQGALKSGRLAAESLSR